MEYLLIYFRKLGSAHKSTTLLLLVLKNVMKLKSFSLPKLSFYLLFLLTNTTALAIDSITFGSGAPLEEYQARVIVPILTEAFALHGIEFNALHLPSLRSLEVSNSGKLDGEVQRSSNFKKITQNLYPNLIRIDCKLLSVYLTVFAKNTITITNWHDLQNYSIAYYRGRKDVGKFLANVLKVDNIYRVNTDIQAFHMLAAGRVDIVISESRVGNEIINSNTKLNNIFEIKRLHQSDIYSYIHKKHEKILPKLINTLNEMKKQGRFEEIISATKQER